jgi:undecaprenyl-diphosphatase
MDIAILNYVQNHCHNKFTDFFFVLLSRLGNGGAIWFAFMFFMASRPRTKRYAFLLFFSVALAYLVSQILKPIIGRPRPFVVYPGQRLLIHIPSGYSCPSGHSSSSFAAATVICMVNYPVVGVAAFLLAFGIAFSRIFLFVHYPSDTAVGAILGVLSAFLIFALYRM